MSESTTPGQPEVAYNTDADAAQALLDRWGIKDDEPSSDESGDQEAPEAEATDEPADEQADEATAEAAGEDEGEDAEDEIELDVAGDKLKLPAQLKAQAEIIQKKVKELEAGSTRKFQEAAELRKSVEAEREQVALLGKIAAEHTDLLADLRSTDREIQSLTNLDWNALSDADPVQAQKAMARLMSLQNARQRIGAQLGEAQRQMQARQNELRQQQFARGQAELARLIPNITDATKTELAQYIATRNLTPEGKEALWDPEVIAAFHDAKKYRELSAAKPAVTKRAAEAPKPALKPSARTGQLSAQKAKEAEAIGRLRKTGHVNDAAAAILARMRKG